MRRACTYRFHEETQRLTFQSYIDFELLPQEMEELTITNSTIWSGLVFTYKNEKLFIPHKNDGPAIIFDEDDRRFFLLGIQMKFDRWLRLSENDDMTKMELKLRYG